MLIPGHNDTAYHSSPRENTAPGVCLSDTAFLTTAVSPIMPETPFNIADSVSELDPERSPGQPYCQMVRTIRRPPACHPRAGRPADGVRLSWVFRQGPLAMVRPGAPGLGPGSVPPVRVTV